MKPADFLRRPDEPLSGAEEGFLGRAGQLAKPWTLPELLRIPPKASTPTGRWVAAGTAVELTPPAGTYLSGYSPFELSAARGTWGRLWATPILLRDPDGTPLLLLPMDLHAGSRYLAERLSTRLAGRIGLSIDRVWPMCVHTHLGPGHFYGDGFYDVLPTTLLSGSGLDRTWLDKVVGDLVTAVLQLDRRLAESPAVALGLGTASLAGPQSPLWNRSVVATAANAVHVEDRFHPTGLGEAVKAMARGWNGAEADPALHPQGPDDDRGWGRVGVDQRVQALIFHAGGRIAAGLVFVNATPTWLGGPTRLVTGDVSGVAGALLRARLGAPVATVGSSLGDTCLIDPTRSIAAFHDGRVASARAWGSVDHPAPATLVGELARGTAIARHLADVAERAVHAALQAPDALGGTKLTLGFVEPSIAGAKVDEPTLPVNRIGEGGRPPGPSHLPDRPRVGMSVAAASELDHTLPFAREGDVATFDPTDPHSPKVPFLGIRGIPEFWDVPPFATLRVAKLGGITLLAVPGEPSTPLVWSMRRRIAPSAPGQVLVAGISGDYLGYFNTREEYMLQQYEGAFQVWGRLAGEWVADGLVALAANPVVRPRFRIAPVASAALPEEPRALGWCDPDGPDGDGVLGARPWRDPFDGRLWLLAEGAWAVQFETLDLTDPIVHLTLTSPGGGTHPLTVDGATVDDRSGWLALRLYGGHPKRIRWLAVLPWDPTWVGQALGFVVTHPVAAPTRPLAPPVVLHPPGPAPHL